ncbi:MAG: hypothetical protein Q4D65_01330 [Peptostreptococcaceae bacterium]|nr:hypothetical protein [Peptostreptococcaceae bacterium]
MKKLWSIAIIIIVTSLLSGCFGKSSNNQTLGNKDFGFVDVKNTDWKPLELSEKSEEMLSTLYFDENTNSIELALYAKEDITASATLENIAEDIQSYISPATSEGQPDSSAESKAVIENVEFGKNKYKALAVTVNYISDLSKEEITARAWIFLDENNLYRYVILDATKDTVDELSKQIIKSFRLEA